MNHLVVFLANYVPKCQMSSGPYGPIFIKTIFSIKWKMGSGPIHPFFIVTSDDQMIKISKGGRYTKNTEGEGPLHILEEIHFY